MAVTRMVLGTLLVAVCAVGGACPRAPASVTTAGVPTATAVAPPASTPAEGEASPAAAGTTVVVGTTVAASTTAIASDEACPGEVETVNGYRDDDGCPDVVPPELAAITGIIAGITFETDKDVIRPGPSRATLDAMVDVLARYPEVQVEIQVHEAEQRESYSLCLSCRRAKAIAEYLVAHGIERARVPAQGYGDNRPIASNRTAEGRQQNRRVEVHLRGVDGQPVMPGG